jgi:serine/threonine-protein kinase
MSPEQMRASGDVDGRTDLWSLGVILFESIAGRSPFDGATIPLICANVLGLPTPPLAIDALPEGLDRVIARALEKEPDARYRDAAHFARALAPFAPEQAAISLPRIQRLRDRSGALVASPASIPPPPVSPAPRSSPPQRRDAVPAVETFDGSHTPASTSTSTPPEGPLAHADRPRRSPFALAALGAALAFGAWLVLGQRVLGRSPAPASDLARLSVAATPTEAGPTVAASATAGAKLDPSPAGSANPSAAAPTPLTSASGSATSSPAPAPSLSAASTVRPTKPPRGSAPKGAQPPRGTSAFGDRE